MSDRELLELKKRSNAEEGKRKEDSSTLRTCLSALLLAAFSVAPVVLSAGEYVVYKTRTSSQAAKVAPGSGRTNDYCIRLGSPDGVQFGTMLNVYRNEEIKTGIAGFKLRTRSFIGRLRVSEVYRSYCVARVLNLRSFADPHQGSRAVTVGDYVLPVFVVQSGTLFDRGSGVLHPGASKALDSAIGFIKRYRPVRVHIEGHTAGEGKENTNLKLSEQRARSVRDYLIDHGGFDSKLFTPVGYGESRPIASNDTPEGQRKNRRFEIVAER